jgi:hypothetical protein
MSVRNNEVKGTGVSYAVRGPVDLLSLAVRMDGGFDLVSFG